MNIKKIKKAELETLIWKQFCLHSIMVLDTNICRSKVREEVDGEVIWKVRDKIQSPVYIETNVVKDALKQQIRHRRVQFGTAPNWGQSFSWPR